MIEKLPLLAQTEGGNPGVWVGGQGNPGERGEEDERCLWKEMTCQYVIGLSRIWQKGTKGISDRGCWPNKPNGANIRCTNQIQGFRAKQTQCSYVNYNQSVTAKIGRLFRKFECERSIKDSVSKDPSMLHAIPPKQTGDSCRAGRTSAGRSKDALANEAGISQKRIRLWKYDPHHGFADTPRTPGHGCVAVRGAPPNKNGCPLRFRPTALAAARSVGLVLGLVCP